MEDEATDSARCRSTLVAMVTAVGELDRRGGLRCGRHRWHKKARPARDHLFARSVQAMPRAIRPAAGRMNPGKANQQAGK